MRQAISERVMRGRSHSKPRPYAIGYKGIACTTRVTIQQEFCNHLVEYSVSVNIWGRIQEDYPQFNDCHRAELT